MIIPNGTIEVKQKTCGGIDPETGYPRRSSDVVWSDPIPCQTLTNKYNALVLSKQGNPITSASYSVLIDEQPFEGEQVRLKDSQGKVIGEFSIIQIEPLDAVCEIRIWI